MALTAYKYKNPSNALSFPVTDVLPLTFATSTSHETLLYVKSSSTYAAGSVVKFESVGSDLSAQNTPYSLSLKLASQPWSAVLPNTPSFTSFVGSNLLLSLSVKADVDGQAIGTYTTSFIRISVLNVSGVTVDYLTIPVLVEISEQGLGLRFRLLTPDRQLPDKAPGFTFGSYRWQEQANAKVLVPTNWTQDLDAIGRAFFKPGIGVNEDLKLKRLYRDGHSILPIINQGEYFLGTNRFYLPSKDAVIDVFPVAQNLVFALSQAPARNLPIYIGTYQSDSSGSFSPGVRYRYVGHIWDHSQPDYQAIVHRAQKQLTLNKTFPVSDAFVDFVPAPIGVETTITATFDVPVFPVWQITAAYINDPSVPVEIVPNSFDPKLGQVTLKIPSTMTGQRLFVRYVPAVAVIYQTEPGIASLDPEAPQTGERLLENTELNPAFSGLASGSIYLLHRRQRAMQLTLAADKPVIPIPATLSSIVGLVAYGPVYYSAVAPSYIPTPTIPQHDFALLIATAMGASTSQKIPGVELRVVPDPLNFEGSVNYIPYVDSSSFSVSAVTGGDGQAVFIYTTPDVYGIYLPTSSIAGATITLPSPGVPLSQLWNVNDGWYLMTYVVRNDDPVLGKVGADPAKGEVSWKTHGTAGTNSYRTNGFRVLWNDGSLVATPSGQVKRVVPKQVYDSVGRAAFNLDGTLNLTSGFNGQAASIVYADAVPTASNAGAYFLGFMGRVVLQVEDPSTGVLSNSIMLQLAPSPLITDIPAIEGYLYLNSSTEPTVGRLNINRLGGAPLPTTGFLSSRY